MNSPFSRLYQKWREGEGGLPLKLSSKGILKEKKIRARHTDALVSTKDKHKLVSRSRYMFTLSNANGSNHIWNWILYHSLKTIRFDHNYLIIALPPNSWLNVDLVYFTQPVPIQSRFLLLTSDTLNRNIKIRRWTLDWNQIRTPITTEIKFRYTLRSPLQSTVEAKTPN